MDANAQISEGGLPPSSSFSLNKSSVQNIEIIKPDLKQTFIEDELSEKKGEAYRMGILLPVNKSIWNSGSWTTLKDGNKIWRLRISSKDALATSLYFNQFYLPKGSKLFLYNDDKSKIIGAFTYKNNSYNSLFATELIEGDAINLEYFEPEHNIDSVKLCISEFNYAYRGISLIKNLKYGFGSSGNCEVNVNCSEGNNWQLYKAAIVRINVKIGGSSKWCTGSLVNNTLQDFKPYLLTADHCETGASVADISQWVFYFNYEAPACNNPSAEGNLAAKSMTGAIKVANGGDGGNTGSDFLLLLLNQDVPKEYNPYFLGWDRSSDSSLSGVSIHHPAGDIKKISTYSNHLSTSYWVNTALPSHWRVQWDPTINGHGVTEGGSSGSPILNNKGLIVGTLTGGDAFCNNLLGPDYYGKFNWHWEKNGLTPTERLKEWLDPQNINPLFLNGISYKKVDFIATKLYAKVGETINFYNLSSGSDFTYKWIFAEGSPTSSEDENPSGIRYFKPGNYDISLTAISTDTSITLLKKNYITIWDDVSIYLNQQSQKLCIDLKNNKFNNINVSVFNILGKETENINFKNTDEKTIALNTNNYLNGVYIIIVTTDSGIYTGKILINF